MTREAAEKYLVGIGGKRDPRSNAAKVFGWSGRQKRWFQVTAIPNSHDVEVTMHASCPCSAKS